MRALPFIAFVAAIVFAAAAQPAAADLLDASGRFGTDANASTFPLRVDRPGRVTVSVTAGLSQGKVAVRLLDGNGKVLFDVAGTRMSVKQGAHVQPGKYQVEVVPRGAIGTWNVKVSEPQEANYAGLWQALLISGAGMLLAALVAAVLGWRLSKAPWWWLAVGAGIWTAAVAVKFVLAALLNGPVLGSLEGNLPRAGYLAAGSAYIGLLSGVTEIGFTFVLGLLWRRTAASWRSAAAIGAGAGAFEAGLMALGPLGAAAMILSHAPQAQEVLAAMQQSMANTPMGWLAGPVERVLAISCHVGTRMLALLAVATGRWRWLAAGFVLFSGLDAVAGYAYISGFVARGNMWWMELALVPFAILSLAAIPLCARRWRAAPAPSLAT
jgi:hypothetical protein